MMRNFDSPTKAGMEADILSGDFRVFSSSDGFPYFVAPVFSTPAFSTSAVCSCIFHFCIFHPCDLLPHFPLLHFPLPHFQRPLDNHDMPCVSQVSDLGITVDTKFKLSTYVSNICVKAHMKANLILRCFESRNISSLIVAFKTYVCPVLEYRSVVWNLSLIKDIDKLKKYKEGS